jgi:hypothetical protein
MADESQLMKRIAELPDDELLRIIRADSSQYRFEALVYAKAEIEKRGITVDEIDIIRATSSLDAKSAPKPLPKIFTWLTSYVATFVVSFISALILFVAVYYYTIEYPAFIDGDGHAGWPFRFYTFGGWAGMSIIDWPYLLADILIALIIGLGIGFIFTGIIGFVKSSWVE